MTGWQVLEQIRAAHNLDDSPVRSGVVMLMRGEGVAVEEVIRHALETVNG